MNIIEKNRGNSRFKNIDNEEVERRRQYLADIKVLVHSMRDNMRKQRLTIRKETKTLRDDLLNTATEEASTESLSEQGRRYIKEQLVKEQEEMIDDLSSGVKRLNEMAHTIQDEIQQHDQLIDGVEIEVDVAQTRLERGRKEIERFLKTRSDRIEWRIDCLDWCLIKTIFFLFLFTVFFVFYTFIS
ncbi:uncharacterized protein [Blastocystis hominis]|uniref:t-SNARE coiled-coil homology domain-containing protein n=1 Tax=Blastocystis hominis TaxID=12968 RepID=D8M7Q3_BLAHO|nr:uncharacterized protein [Blastocystis hominis]CBK24092.2 unnamed protein product [Blastocystis hominis]|eukprot:XP_012898140.1 uncharacterized protein [Blastocystis hominis]